MKIQIRDGVLERINKLMGLSQALVNEYMRTNFPRLPPIDLIRAGGTRYFSIRSIREEQMAGSAIKPELRWSAWAFIDLTNGDILRPATWRKPAKHARGNVFDEDYGMKYITPHGPMYMEEAKHVQGTG